MNTSQYTAGWPKDIQDIITAMHNKGFTLDEISKVIGKSIGAIGKQNSKLRDSGLVPMYITGKRPVSQYTKIFTPELCKTILQRHIDGETIDEIGYDIGILPSRIHAHNSKMRKNGLPQIFTRHHTLTSRSKRDFGSTRETEHIWRDRVTPMEKAMAFFNPTLQEGFEPPKRLTLSRVHGYLLDGKPITVREILKKAGVLPE